MAYLGARPTTNFRVAPTKDTFTGDGSTTTFDLANVVPAGGENALQVFVENVRQEPGSGKAYTLGADGSGDLKRITFSSAPVASAEIYVITTFSNESFAKIGDLKGSEFVLDADGDTTITADTDDTIDVKIAGADDFQFTANTFTAQSGSGIVIPDGGLTLGSTAVGSTAAELNLLDGSAKSTSSITLADADAFIVIDGSTTKQIPASDIKTYTPGATSWQAVVVGDGSTGVTMVAGRGYFVNTTSGTITMTLPSSASIGDTIQIIDYAGTADTNNITIGRNSHKIQGETADLTVSTERAAFTLVYVDATQGWLLDNK